MSDPNEVGSAYPVKVPHITLNIGRGCVVLPSWLAALGGVIFLCAVLSLLVVLLVAGPQLGNLAKEVRVLGLHVEDVESVLKDHGLATERDFAGWGNDTGPGHRAQKKGS